MEKWVHKTLMWTFHCQYECRRICGGNEKERYKLSMNVYNAVSWDSSLEGVIFCCFFQWPQAFWLPVSIIANMLSDMGSSLFCLWFDIARPWWWTVDGIALVVYWNMSHLSAWERAWQDYLCGFNLVRGCWPEKDKVYERQKHLLLYQSSFGTNRTCLCSCLVARANLE